MRPTCCIVIAFFAVAFSAFAQTPGRSPNVSDKALITKSTPPVSRDIVKSKGATALHKLADDYYGWRNEQYPVRSSDAGLHTWDNRLTDYSAAAITARARHHRELLDQVRAMYTSTGSKDDQVDWLLFRSQLELPDFDTRILKSEQRDPQVYTSECAKVTC